MEQINAGQDKKMYLVELMLGSERADIFLTEDFRAAMDRAFDMHKKHRDPLDNDGYVLAKELYVNSATDGKRIGRWKLNQPHPDEF
jgi:hypothetical protein